MTCTTCCLDPCRCLDPFPSTFTMEGSLEEIVITGSPEHQAQCDHSFFDLVANKCINCSKVLGPSLPEQLEELRTRVAALETALSQKVEKP